MDSMLTRYNLLPKSFEIIDQKLNGKGTILELGTGEGTAELIKRGYQVYSIEAHREWMKYKSEYIYAPLKKYKKKTKEYQWYDKQYLTSLKAIPYNLLIIDGPRGNEGRGNIVHFLDLFDLSTHILIDDTERAGEYAIYEAIRKAIGREGTTYKQGDKEFIWIDSV